MKKNGLHEEVLMAGFGGQGVMLAGKLLAYTAMQAGKEVTYMPSYGAEVRGGTANCMVVVSNKPVASPVVSKPSSVIAMNKASLKKFSSRVKPGGLLVYNRSLIDSKPEVEDDVEVLAIPADELAVELGNKKCANMVALGAYLQRKGFPEVGKAAESLPKVLAKRHHKTLGVNTKALQRGAEFASRKK